MDQTPSDQQEQEEDVESGQQQHEQRGQRPRGAGGDTEQQHRRDLDPQLEHVAGVARRQPPEGAASFGERADESRLAAERQPQQFHNAVADFDVGRAGAEQYQLQRAERRRQQHPEREGGRRRQPERGESAAGADARTAAEERRGEGRRQQQEEVGQKQQERGRGTAATGERTAAAADDADQQAGPTSRIRVEDNSTGTGLLFPHPDRRVDVARPPNTQRSGPPESSTGPLGPPTPWLGDETDCFRTGIPRAPVDDPRSDQTSSADLLRRPQ
jgi:hypothetical protein